MHFHRNTAAVVSDRTGTVRFQSHPNRGAGSRQMLIYRIIYNLINQVIQSFGSNASNIHAGALAHCFQPFQYGNTVRVIL